MTRPAALGASRAFLRFLMVLNALYAAAIGALLVGTYLFPRLLPAALVGLEGGDAWQVHAGLRVLVVLGLLGAVIAHRVLRHLLAIVDTVRDGDPFVAANADRLQSIAWWVLGGEGLRLAIAALIRGIRTFVPAADIDPPAFSFAPLLAVVLLFVLAGVFRHGTRLRADLEGTV
jgi:hypothetical protein